MNSSFFFLSSFYPYSFLSSLSNDFSVVWKETRSSEPPCSNGVDLYFSLFCFSFVLILVLIQFSTVSFFYFASQSRSRSRSESLERKRKKGVLRKLKQQQQTNQTEKESGRHNLASRWIAYGVLVHRTENLYGHLGSFFFPSEMSVPYPIVKANYTSFKPTTTKLKEASI